MIPKSVSGSTLIVALGAVLAWPVWGWAETLGQRAMRETGGQWVPCSQLYGASGNECRVSGSTIEVRPSCEQRMSEAMREMDAYIERMDAINGPGKKLIIYPGGLRSEKWDQTMKDCVEGRH